MYRVQNAHITLNGNFVFLLISYAFARGGRGNSDRRFLAAIAITDEDLVGSKVTFIGIAHLPLAVVSHGKATRLLDVGRRVEFLLVVHLQVKCRCKVGLDGLANGIYIVNGKKVLKK